MANTLTLPDLGTTSESIQDILSEQRDVSIRIESIVERSYSKLNIIEDVLKSQLAIQEQQANFLRTQSENAEFAAEEARREAERSRLAASSATATLAADRPGGGGFGLGGVAAGLAGGLAAGGAGAALRTLAGRLLRGGGLAALGYYFGDQLGKFLATEADALLDDAGVSQEWQDTIVNSLRENTDTALIFGGISKILFKRTLPGLIAGYVLGGLDIEKLFSNDEAERQEFYQNLEDEIITGWDFIYDRPQAAAIFGVGAGLALLTRGPLLKRLAVGLIGAYGLSNLLPGDEDIDTFNTRMTNAVVSELELMGFSETAAEAAVDIGDAAFSGLTTGWLAGLINKRLKIPAMIAGFLWSYFDLSRIFTPEGRDSLGDSVEESVRRLLTNEGMSEDYINATIAALGISAGAVAGSRILNRPPSSPETSTTPDQDRDALRRRVQGLTDAELENAGLRRSSNNRIQRITPSGSAAGAFVSNAEVDDLVRQSKIKSRFPRMSKRMFGALIGAGLTAAEMYLILENENTSPAEKAQQLGGAAIGLLGGAAVGALIGFVASWYTGPGTLVITGLASLAGYAFGDWMATAFFEWMLEARSDNELSTLNNNITNQIAGIGSQADVNAYLREYGILIGPTDNTPSTSTVQGGRGSINEAPGARALAGQISGVQTQLNNARQERSEASNRAARRAATQNVLRLERALEELEEQLEQLNETFRQVQAPQPENVSYVAPQTSEGRVIMAAARGNNAPRPMQAAFNPSFGQPELIRASLSTEGTSTPPGQTFPIPLTGGAEARGAESSLVFQPLFGNALTAMYNAAPEYVQSGLRILSGYRSPDFQARLYEQKLMEVRAAHPEWSDAQVEAEARRWVAPPGSSRHNTGQAVDLSYANNRVKQWVHNNAERYGLHFPLANEDWHIEMMGLDGRRVAMADTPPVSFANIRPSQTPGPDTMIAEGPSAEPSIEPVAPSDQRAADSMLADIGSGGGAGGSSFFDAFNGGLGAVLGSSNPEEAGAILLQDFFSQIGVGRPGVTPGAVELNRGSENATTAPIVINAPQINNDNSVQASGGGGRERTSQQLAIAPIGERSVASTISDWWDATMA
jgi:LAS superfamily LD-carboxypeptidase LdcB